MSLDKSSTHPVPSDYSREPNMKLSTIIATSLVIGAALGVMALPQGQQAALSWWLCSTIGCLLFGVVGWMGSEEVNS